VPGGQPLELGRVLVDHGDLVVLHREDVREVGAYHAAAADYHPGTFRLRVPGGAGVSQVGRAVQGRKAVRPEAVRDDPPAFPPEGYYQAITRLECRAVVPVQLPAVAEHQDDV
jgi:hypothetical protein